MSEEQLMLELHHMFKTCDYYGEDDDILTDYDFIFKNITDLQKEIARLNKIIERLEKYLLDIYISTGYEELYKIGIKDSYDKLQELKEEGK